MSGSNMMDKLRKIVEVLTNVAILCVCGLLAWTMITHRSIDPRSIFVRNGHAHLVGTLVPAIHGYSWSSRRLTLVLAIRKDCQFCHDSLPFYKRLSELEKNYGLQAHLLAVMPDDATLAAADLQSAGISVESVYNQPLDAIRITGTPTLLLVDASGRVKREWYGRLTPSSEKEVIEAVRM